MSNDKVYDALAENQLAAIGRPCKEENCTGHYVERRGKFGPFVTCTTDFSHKVYRPRGRDGGRKAKSEQMTQQEQTTQSQATSDIVLEGAAIADVHHKETMQTTPASGIEAAIVNAIMPHVESALSKVQVDASSVTSAVRAEVDRALGGIDERIAALKSQQAVRIEVVQHKDDGTSVTATIDGAHYLMPRLLKLVDAGFHVYLYGPAGSGKTTAAMQAATALGRESEIDTLDPSTFRSMVQGYMTPTGEPVHTSFTRCWSSGKVYIADETDNAPGHVQTLFNSALANGHAPLAWGNVPKGGQFGFIGTGNTPGMPTRAFPDRKPMSAAFKDRLYFMHWPLDAAIECRAAGLAIPMRDERPAITMTAEAWGTMVQSLRAWAASNMPTLMVTPRATLSGLKALAIGEHPADVADALIFRGCDDEMRKKAVNACAAGLL